MGSAHSLQRLLERRIRVLAEHLPSALDGEVKGVHQARVASRRLREAVPVAGAALAGRRVQRLQRRLRRLTRVLGPVREQDVSLGMLEEQHGQDDASVELLELVRGDVAREREARYALLVQKVDPGRVRRLSARLEKFAATIPDPALSTEWRDELARRISRRAHALQAAVADAGALFVAERLHAVRIAVKQLRYALELAGEARTAPTGALVRQLREVQDLLGELHDHDVLRAQLDAALDVPDPRPDLADARARVAAALDTQIRVLHARYLRRQAALIRVADRALDAIAPRVGLAEAPRQ